MFAQDVNSATTYANKRAMNDVVVVGAAVSKRKRETLSNVRVYALCYLSTRFATVCFRVRALRRVLADGELLRTMPARTRQQLVYIFSFRIIAAVHVCVRVRDVVAYECGQFVVHKIILLYLCTVENVTVESRAYSEHRIVFCGSLCRRAMPSRLWVRCGAARFRTIAGCKQKLSIRNAMC